MTCDTTTKRQAGGDTHGGKTPAAVEPPSRRVLVRQHRLGILYNPNRAPAPPARRARLMGKWLSLRSSRRPRTDAFLDAVEACHAMAKQCPGAYGPDDAAPPPQKAGPERARGDGVSIVRLASDDSLRIDTERLMAAVAGHGRKQFKRRPFAEVIAAPPGHPARRMPPALQAGPERAGCHTDMTSAEAATAPAITAGGADRQNTEGGPVDALSTALRSPAHFAGPRAALKAAVCFPRLVIGQNSEPGKSTPDRSARTRPKRSLMLRGIAVILVTAAAVMVFVIARLLPVA